METRFVKFNDVKPVYAFQGIARRALNWGEQAMLLQNNFAPGTGVPEHAHANEQISYVAEGTLVVVVSGISYTLNAGDSILMPSNAPHSASSPQGAVVLEVFAPPREDFK